MVAILYGSKIASADLDPIVIKVCAMSCTSSVEGEEETSELTSLSVGFQVLLQF